MKSFAALCVVLSVFIAGCSTSNTHKKPMDKVGYELGLQRLRHEPAFYSKQFNTCLVRAKKAPIMPTWASLMRVSVQEAPRVYCKRLFTAYLKGRVSYEDFNAARDDIVTPGWFRVIVKP